MVDKRALCKDLTMEFINYQHQLESILPSKNDAEIAKSKYDNDPIFRAKVKTLVCGVMQTLEKHI